MDRHEMEDRIVLIWHIDDIWEIRPDLHDR